MSNHSDSPTGCGCLGFLLAAGLGTLVAHLTVRMGDAYKYPWTAFFSRFGLPFLYIGFAAGLGIIGYVIGNSTARRKK